MKITIWNAISLLFVGLAILGLMGFLFWNAGILGLEEAILFSIIAVIFSYLRAFLVFVFYFIIVSLVMVVAGLGIAYLFGFSLNDLNALNGTEFLFWSMGSLTLDFGVSAFLTKRTRDEEKEKEAGYGYYEKPPNPNDFNQEEQEKREKEAYEKGRREAEVQSNKMSVEEACKILGVNSNASKEEIKKAYRKLGKLIHPDASGIDTNALMKEVNEAYSILEKEGKV
jgi:hypothetical protein